MRQSIEMILAATIHGEIGCKNKLPWRLNGDLRRFKELTMGKVLIVGRKTYESFPGPLKGRIVIVVSKRLAGQRPPSTEVHFVSDFEQALMTAAIFQDVDKIFLAGGVEIYKIGLKIADFIHLTTVYKESEGTYDAIIPDFNLSAFESPMGPVSIYETNVHGIDVVSHTYSTYKRRQSQHHGDD